MFSGKSDEYLRLAKVYAVANQSIMLFKPENDIRDDPELVKTRSGRPSSPAIRVPLDTPEVIIEQSRGADAIIVDEIQFFPSYLAEILDYLAHNKRKEVYAFGLDRDFRNVPFETTMRVMAYADDPKKLFAICKEADDGCRNKARATQRIFFGTRTPAPYHSERVVVQQNTNAIDSTEAPPVFDYTAACYEHFEVPGAPTFEQVLVREKRRAELMKALDEQLRSEGF